VRSRKTDALPPAGLRPASEYRPGAVHRRARSREVLSPLSAIESSRATTPGLTPYPGHVAPSRLSCATAPYSLDDLPGSISTRRAHGVLPSELDLAEIACTSRRRLPLLRLTMPDRWFFYEKSVAGALGLRPRRVSLQGFSLCRLGWTRWMFSALRPPWLSWVSPPWGSPLRCSASRSHASP
jgi:hypothetical protein